MPAQKPIPSPQDDVGTALHLLQEALEDEEQRIRSEGAQAMTEGEYDTATEVIEFAKRLQAFQDKVASLEREWRNLEDVREHAAPAVQEIVSKRFFGRGRSPDITSHFAFCQPLLEVLVAMGGKAKTKEAIDRLGQKMKGKLKPKDYETHKSKGHQIRWRNSAQWARNWMVNHEGLMKKGEPGVWEVSDKGRAWLRSLSKPKRPK
ncbi:MAG: winged helix-turn-helix domain-containing protein [Verrucomicrobiaceae bacterium]|nr:winged helix-turn-helix domain-containing protein [Verrucomicrobiaceae bacterium]